MKVILPYKSQGALGLLRLKKRAYLQCLLSLLKSTIARLRLTYLDPQDLHHHKSSQIRRGPPGATYHMKMMLAAKNNVEYCAYSPVLHQRVAIRLQGLGREKFEIRTLGRKGKVIKPLRYDGE